MPLNVLGSRIDPVTFESALAKIESFLLEDWPHHVITGNTLMCLEAEKDRELKQILESAALVVPESSGILWASKKLGTPLKEFVPGIDLMLEICRIAETQGKRIYLLGSAPGVAESAALTLLAKFPKLQIAGTHDGYFRRQDDLNVIEGIHTTHPSILFVGMGMPAQEKWIAKHLDALAIPIVMGVGGSFDVLSGKLRRAPAWMRRLGIEWLYRLAHEPWRWRRIAQLPVFACKVMYRKRRVPA